MLVLMLCLVKSYVLLQLELFSAQYTVVDNQCVCLSHHNFLRMIVVLVSRV